jgi:hypothetical protein
LRITFPRRRAAENLAITRKIALNMYCIYEKENISLSPKFFLSSVG